MEIVLFTANAILVYLLADWILRAIEKKRGEAIKHRHLIFFAVFLVLILASFETLKIILAAG